MNILKRIYRNQNTDVAAILLRLMLGVLFISAGWMKIQHPEFVAGFVQSGYTAFEYHLVAWTELIGGILVIIGLLNKPATVALSIIMAVVVWGGYPDQEYNIFWGNNYEFVIFVSLLALYFMGPGKVSVGHWIRSRRSQAMPAGQS